MWRKIREEIRQNSKKGLILACSGGMDSMFVFHFLKRNNIPFIVGHFDHNIRPTSYIDRNFVINECIANNIDFSVGQGSNIHNENDARNQRYDFFSSLAINTNNNLIITGHHFNDQIETAIFRLTRGIPLTNLKMKKYSGKLYRPFLNVTREDIELHVKLKKINYIQDETNLSSEYDRNFIRNEIIPKLMERRNIISAMKKNLMEN